jgi:hypothetical protein
MLVFPSERKMHITRIFGTNADGDLISDIWIDVLRIDEITFKTQDVLHFNPLAVLNTGPNFANQYQEFTIRFHWADDDQGQGDGKLESRTHEPLKVCSPNEDDLDNPTEWVELPIVTKYDLTASEGNVSSIRRFLAKALNSAREVENRRVLHYDTNIDNDAQSAVDVDGAEYYRVSTDDYQWLDDTKDDTQYIEVEIPTKLKGQATHHWLMTSGDDLETFWNFKNAFLIDASDEAQLDVTGSDGFNPPYRTDPFQAIINVSFGSLAVEFGDKDKDAPTQ